MKDNFSRSFGKAQQTFTEFSSGQKVVAILGTGALLLAGFMVFQWASAPSYTPLFSNVSAADASAIVEKLDAEGVPYEITNGGSTINVPRDVLYDTRIMLSGEGLPADTSNGGYSILDDQGLSTSQFQEQTDFKRAMEGELATTIEAIDGVETAVVHLAMPEKEVFADQQNPTTASVLVATRAGTSLTSDQVQAIVNLVASSIDGLQPDNVTVADSSGTILSAPADSSIAAASTQSKQVSEFQNRMNSQVQSMLDRVLGPGNSAVQVTAVLGFDTTVTETTRYFDNPGVSLSKSEKTETYKGPGAASQVGGVVGPDGQMDPGATTTGDGSEFTSSEVVSDNAVTTEHEVREAAPGGVESIHLGIVLDTNALNGIEAGEVEDLVAAAIGIDPERGDTIAVSQLPFDRTGEEAAAEEIKASEEAAKMDQYYSYGKTGGLVGLVALMVVLAWLQSKKNTKKREQATSYMVDQLRRDALERATAQNALDAHNAAMAALEAGEPAVTNEIRDEIAALVERQPEDVAALLRGWLVERG
jgi:flagellar M-ring protein FliF